MLAAPLIIDACVLHDTRNICSKAICGWTPHRSMTKVTLIQPLSQDNSLGLPLCLEAPIMISFPFLSFRFLSFPFLSFPFLSFPFLSFPFLSLPCLALPCLALPCLALPCLALPCLDLPFLVFSFSSYACGCVVHECCAADRQNVRLAKACRLLKLLLSHLEPAAASCHRVFEYLFTAQVSCCWLQVDVIVSEWMGYALLFESMLDTVLYARDRSALASACSNILQNPKLEVSCSDSNVNFVRLNVPADSDIVEFMCSPFAFAVESQSEAHSPATAESGLLAQTPPLRYTRLPLHLEGGL